MDLSKRILLFFKIHKEYMEVATLPVQEERSSCGNLLTGERWSDPW